MRDKLVSGEKGMGVIRQRGANIGNPRTILKMPRFIPLKSARSLLFSAPLCAVLLLLQPAPAAAQEGSDTGMTTLELPPGFAFIDLHDWAMVPAQGWNTETLPPDSLEWTPLQGHKPGSGNADLGSWFLVRMAWTPETRGPWILEIANPQLPHIQPYVRRGPAINPYRPGRINLSWEGIRAAPWRALPPAGARVAFKERSLPYRLPAYELALDKHQSAEILLYIKSDGSNRAIPMKLWDAVEWERQKGFRLTLLSAFFSVIAIIALFGLVISLVISIPFRWPWLAFTLSGTALSAVYAGLGQQWLWPGSASLQSLAAPLFGNLTIYSGIALLQVLYRTSARHPDPNRLLNILRRIFLIMAGAALFIPLMLDQAHVIRPWLIVQEVLYLSSALLILGTLLVLFRREMQREVLVMLAALAPLSLSSIWHSLQSLDLLPQTRTLDTLDWTGIAVAVLLLTLILLRRIRGLMDEGYMIFSQAALQRRQNTYALLKREAEVRNAIGQDIEQRLDPLLERVEEGLSSLEPLPGDLLVQFAEARAEIRGICENRIPSNLTEHGLLKAIDEIILPLENAGTEVYRRYPKVRRLEKLDLLYQLAIFRIVQGLLNNVYKHASASAVWLHIDVETERLSLLVRDNGVGSESPQDGGGRGLHIIRQRVQSLSGEFSWQSDPGEGTEVQIQIPLKF